MARNGPAGNDQADRTWTDKALYDSPLGAAYSAYMERPRLSQSISRLFLGGDNGTYYESMGAIGEVADGGTIVDCPCGAGPALRALDPGAAVRYVAADLSPSMLRRARQRARTRGLDQVEPIEADATEIPLPSDSADLFLTFWGLHCFEDPAAALAEAARVLRPDGRLIGSSFVRGSGSRRQRWLVRPNMGGFGPIGSQVEIEAWLAAAGFAMATAKRSGPMLFFDARLRDS